MKEPKVVFSRSNIGGNAWVFKKWDLPRLRENIGEFSIRCGGREQDVSVQQANCPEFSRNTFFVCGDDANSDHATVYLPKYKEATIIILDELERLITEHFCLDIDEVWVNRHFPCSVCGEVHHIEEQTWQTHVGAWLCQECTSKIVTCTHCGLTHACELCPNCHPVGTCEVCHETKTTLYKVRVSDWVVRVCDTCKDKSITLGEKLSYNYKPKQFWYHQTAVIKKGGKN